MAGCQPVYTLSIILLWMIEAGSKAGCWPELMVQGKAGIYELLERIIEMPYVNIRVTKEGVTSQQKSELIAGVTELLQRVLQKNPATTVVVIDEVEPDNWGIAGEQVTLRRKRGE